MLPLVAVLISLVTVAVGAPLDDDRIVGGVNTTIEKYPHQVVLLYENSLICGGSIINERHVVTATHCVKGRKPRSFSVLVGVTNREANEGVNIDVESVVYHDTELRIVDGDVAILKLKKAITFGRKAQPIALPPENQEPRPGDMLNVTGWGTTSDRDLSAILQVVQVPVVDRETCRAAYEEMSNISKYMICAGVPKKDSCRGDSGGPLINSKKELVGIVSWGKGCGKPGYPGVYTNVAHPVMRNFIIENSKE